MLKSLFEHHGIITQLFILLLLIIIFWMISVAAGMLAAYLFFGVSPMEILSSDVVPVSRTMINVMKLLQLFNQLGVFIIPCLVFAVLVSEQPASYLGVSRIPGIFSIMATIMLMYLILPMVSELVQINESIKLPDWMGKIEQWMRNTENKAAEITSAFLKTTSIRGLAVNLLIIGLVASVGEELLFRSVLIRLLSRKIKNIHWVILISAVIFSAIHLQFYGFLPRLLLGVIFGYLFVWSGSVWLPIVGHLINNGSAVVVQFLANRGVIDISMEDFGTVTDPLSLIMSIILSVILFALIYLNERNNLSYLRRKLSR